MGRHSTPEAFLDFLGSLCVFLERCFKTPLFLGRPAVPLEWLFLRLRFGVTFALFLRVWANTRPACREYARRSKDGFEHPEFSILKAPIKKILGVHHVRNAFSCFRSPSRCGISRRPASERGSGPAPFRHVVRRTPRSCEGRANPRGNPPLSISSFGCALRKELLEAEDAEEMRELLFRAFSSLETFADLLELMNPEAKVEGVVMHTLARELRRIGRLVFKIQDAYSTVELVEA